MAVHNSTEHALLQAYEAALVACDPEKAVSSVISVDASGITVGTTHFEGARPEEIVIVAIGKAASAMARGAADVLGPLRGIAASNHSSPCPVELHIGSHPVPTKASIRAGEALLKFVRGLEPTDIVIFLISGGGSAIAIAPGPGISLEDLAMLNQELLRSGMPIDEMNEVRSAVSQIKGGRLAAASRASRSVSLVLNDVPGLDSSLVSSGPSLGAGMGKNAPSILSQHSLRGVVTGPMRDAINSPTRSLPPSPASSISIGSSAVAAEAAAAFLNSLGFKATITTTTLNGEAREVARALVDSVIPGTISVASGETTVSVTGTGKGGRSQEAALAAAIRISGTNKIFAAMGTDGIDGPTLAAGAIVNGATAARAAKAGIDLSARLLDNDSHTALSPLGVLVVRGNTGTNVGDLWMVADCT